ncbi:MAG: DUF3380 domain-containing protein [Acidobacteria bacterium]|jgi:hypothetical protein|nr:MAG: DUF3380 domain-containing protein [Acidobacteriota bacterium]GIU82147.1 MAG: hypothetical protein KatS3mg006_1211 [Pyrinomonadaceae bacterium]
MSLKFSKLGLPLGVDGLQEVLEMLKINSASLWAVLTVETLGCGFLPDRRPQILFERHIFSRETKGKFDKQAPDISNPKPGGYGKPGAFQYERLEKAMALAEEPALKSASWGLAQVMGFNHKKAGYKTVYEMVQDFVESEDNQLLGMAQFLKSEKLDVYLRQRDWANFARRYNGPAYKQNSYDSRLAAAYRKFRYGPLPDLAVRQAQVFLIYLGFNPGPVDGVMGRFTRSAMNEFQEKNGLPETKEVTEEVLKELRKAVENLLENEE